MAAGGGAAALPSPIAPTTQGSVSPAPAASPAVEEAPAMPIIKDLEDLERIPDSPAPAKKKPTQPVSQPSPVKQPSCMSRKPSLSVFVV